MEPKQPNKQKPVSSLYDGVPVPAKGKNAKAGSKPRSKANPSIVLIDLVPVIRHPPPPRRLPAKHFKKTVPATKSTHASSSASMVSDLSIDV
jgi:hypothetical protein